MRRFYRFGFSSQSFEIEINNDQSYGLAEFLFRDLPSVAGRKAPERYAIIAAGAPAKWSLWREQQLLYFGESKHELACMLMSEVVYRSVEGTDTQIALHGAAVYRGDSCVILPGSSGAGKSTLASWLISHGYGYLTDELVLLSPEGTVTPFTRPISLNVLPGHLAWGLEPGLEEHVVLGDGENPGALVPHRLLNGGFRPVRPIVTHLVFPEFSSGVQPRCKELTSAESLLFLLQSHVNVRILPDHGMPSLSALVKRCRSYHLVYGSFDGMDQIFKSLLATSP